MANRDSVLKRETKETNVNKPPMVPATTMNPATMIAGSIMSVP